MEKIENINPLFDRLLVREVQTPDTGIYIPPSGKERSFLMEVLSVGNEVKFIKPTQVVLIAKYAGVEVPTPHNQKHYIIRECDVLGVLEVA